MRVGALVEAYRAGTATPKEVVGAAFDRAASQAGRASHAWISLADREHALATAEEVDLTLPLAGVPFAVKDNIDVAGMVTTAACPGFASRASATAPVVQRLRDAGAILVGKTNLDQFATGLVGTRSPYGAPVSAADPRYVSGGSSSGSAVAVADGTVAFALGTDTAGSGRVPAAFNGVVGLKPTRGLVSVRGVLPACRSLDCVSVFSADVDGARRVLDVVAGFDPADPWSRRPGAGSGPVPSPVLGVPSRLHDLDARYARAWADAVTHARELGTAIVDVDLGLFEEAARLLYDGPWLAERWLAVGTAIEAGVQGLDPVVASVVSAGRDVPAADVFAGRERLMELRREADELFAAVDAVLLPTTPTIPTPAEVAAEPVAVNRRLGRWTNGVNLLDLAAISVPAAGSPPFGVSLLAPAWSEALLLHLGARWLGEDAPRTGASAGPSASVEIAVVGAHLAGQPLNHELTSRGGRLVAPTLTAPCYRLVALPGGPPHRPGLLREREPVGAGVEVELWALPAAEVGGFLSGVPAPLCIGTVELTDGSTTLGFLCEAHAADGATDITHLGGWRSYVGA